MGRSARFLAAVCTFAALMLASPWAAGATTQSIVVTPAGTGTQYWITAINSSGIDTFSSFIEWPKGYADLAGYTMGSAYRAATRTSDNFAPLSINFTGTDTAFLTLSNGRTTNLIRQRF